LDLERVFVQGVYSSLVCLWACGYSEFPIVQLGFMICNTHGNLNLTADYDYYHGGGGYVERAWEVDFNIRRDRHATQSAVFLRSQGVGSAAFERSGRSSLIYYWRCCAGPGMCDWRSAAPST
jgi:hypothetical protein